MNAFEENITVPRVEGWDVPNAIETRVTEVMAMTPELMPEPLRGWLCDISHRMQTPADFATVSAIVMIGSLVGSGCGVRPKQRDDWEVIPNVWGACVGRPSVLLKSPSMAEPMRMLERIQADYREQFEQSTCEFEADKLFYEAALKDIEKRMTNAAKGKLGNGDVDAETIATLKNEYSQLKQSDMKEPARRLFKTNETSIQSMTVLQQQNDRGLLVHRDELTALLARWDREEHADERAYYLEGWNGNGSFTDVKIGRGTTDAENICISLLGGIQPDKLKRYLYQAIKGNNDGLMQRLQLAVYPDIPKNWRLVDIYPDKEQKERVYNLISSLVEMDFVQLGASFNDSDKKPYFRFNEDAQHLFNEWLTLLHTKKLKEEDNPLMLEHLGKYRSLMPSLSLIFHCIGIADGKASDAISIESAQLAIDWCDYLESHARRIYAMTESPEREAAASLSKKIKSHQLPNPFTAKMVYDKGWHGLKKRQDVEAACAELIDENWLVRQVKNVGTQGGRPPLPEFFINPVLLEKS